MVHTGVAPEVILGPLNKVEARFAPKQVFYRGDLEILQQAPRISVIGSRSADHNALHRTKVLSKTIVTHGGVVVSGLAHGVDTAAHKEAIERGGRTIAIVGTPPDDCYPKENTMLQERIGRDHLLLSQFAPGTPVTKKRGDRANSSIAGPVHPVG